MLSMASWVSTPHPTKQAGAAAEAVRGWGGQRRARERDERFCSSGSLDHDGHALGMYGAEVRVLEEVDHVELARLLPWSMVRSKV